jgi:cobalt/nickel transport system ATP-binding protein
LDISSGTRRGPDSERRATEDELDRERNSEPAIEVADLRFSYPGGHLALAGASFEVRSTESVALMGPNGVGKSTLLLCIVGIHNGSGRIRVQGIELTTENLQAIRRRVGFVFQNPEHQLFSTSVLDDVVFGPLNLGLSKEAAMERADMVLDKLNLSHLRHRVPQHLSQGEKKKVALATALAMDPDVLMLDEPTAGLDPRSATQLIDTFFQLKDEGKAMLVATHDMHLVDEIADRIIVLGESRTVVREGPPAEILSDTEFLAGHNLIHEHGHFHERERHGHPHFHKHQGDDHIHPHG